MNIIRFGWDDDTHGFGAIDTHIEYSVCRQFSDWTIFSIELCASERFRYMPMTLIH